MAKQQDPNSLGAMMAAQNELNGINAARLQNSQEEQAFLQQQQAANAVMMQAAQIGASGGLGQQVGAMNPQTQAILAQYGVNAAPMPGKTTTSNKVSQSGGNIRIENKTTTNNDVKVINAGTGGASGEAGNQAKFQTWLSNAFAKQQTDYEVQRRVFARRDRDLEKQSNKMMRELEKTNKGLSEKLSPESWQKTQGNQLKTVLTVLMLTLSPLIVKPIAKGLDSIKSFFGGEDSSDGNFFSKLKTAIGLDDKTKSPLEAIGNVIKDGIKGIQDWFGLLFEERSRAIESIKKPGAWDKLANPISSWITYLGNVLSAGLGGFKALSSANASQMRRDAQKDSTTSGKTAVNLQDNAHAILEHNQTTDYYRTISSNYYDIAGRLKGGESAGSIAVTRSLWAEIDNGKQVGSKVNASLIGKRMADLENLLERQGAYRMGERKDAINFLKVWGLDETYLNTLIDEKFIIVKEYIYITWAKNKKRINGVHSGVFLKEEGLPSDIDTHEIIDQSEKTIYFMTKEGFEKIKFGLFGNKNFKFSDSSNDSIIHNKLSTIHEDVSFKNEDRLQQLSDTNSISSSYQTSRENVSFGTAGKVAGVVSNTFSSWKDKASGFIGSAWKTIRGATLKGKYLNTDAGKQNFVQDLYGVFSKELYSYYINKGLSEEEASKRASSMAGILTAQCVVESGYGTNSNSEFYNYANLTGKGRDGVDHDAKGKVISQSFKKFSSGEEFAQALINLLDKAPQYQGSLLANSAEEYFKKIQRGYDGKYNPLLANGKINEEDKGKFAQDVEYVTKGVNAANEIIPKIEEYVKSLGGNDTSEKQQDNSDLTFNAETPHYITPDGLYKVEFDRLKIGNLGKGETPWDARTGIFMYNEKTGQYDIPIDSTLMDKNDPNSLAATVNRGVSQNQYPELNSLMLDDLGKGGVLFHVQRLNSFSSLAQNFIKITEDLAGLSKNRDSIYKKIPFYLTPTKDGKQFTITTVSVKTWNNSREMGPLYTGTVFHMPTGKFPPEFYKIPENTKRKGLPTGRNPLFYSIDFDLNEDGYKSLRIWEQTLKSGFHLDSNGILVDGTGEKMHKNDVERLEKLGLISNIEKQRLGIGNVAWKANITESGKTLQKLKSSDERSGYYDNRYKYLSASDWEKMSPEEKKNYFTYLSSLTPDPNVKASIKMLEATSDGALQAAQALVGVSSPSLHVAYPTAQRVKNTQGNLVETPQTQTPIFQTPWVNTDNSQVHTTYNIYGSDTSEAQAAVDGGK